MKIKDLTRTLKRCLKVMPVAAECPAPNVNRVDYTDKEWDEIVALTEWLEELIKEIS